MRTRRRIAAAAGADRYATNVDSSRRTPKPSNIRPMTVLHTLQEIARGLPTRNLSRSSNVSTKGFADVRWANARSPGGCMSLIKKLFGKADPPKQRVRVSVECGMPIAEHKEWC